MPKVCQIGTDGTWVTVLKEAFRARALGTLDAPSLSLETKRAARERVKQVDKLEKERRRERMRRIVEVLESGC
jgi:hypothetical protein